MAEQEIGRCATGRAQVRRVSRDGWTAKRKRVLLRMLAATANIRASVAAAGKSHESFYDLRWRDPEFAEQCRAALEMGYEGLEAMLMERAGRGRASMKLLDPADGEEIPVPDPAEMDTDLALKLLALRGRTLSHTTRPRRQPRRFATREETDAAILRQLSVLNRRLGGAG